MPGYGTEMQQDERTDEPLSRDDVGPGPPAAESRYPLTGIPTMTR